MTEVTLGAAGRRWAVATPHTLATQAGAAAFEAGGNAVDAALAAAVTLAVAYPHMCGVGGDLFALVQRPDAEVLAVSSSGRSPRAADPQAARLAGEPTGAGYPAMPVRGPIPITVPGAVAGWEALHHLGAVLPWADAFATAIALAFDGVAVSRSLSSILQTDDGTHAADPGLSSLFFHEGVPVALGDVVHQPALGATLRSIAEEGADALYRGEVGRAYAEGLRAAGSPVTAEDLAAHRPLVVPPLRAEARGLHVSVVPPNSQGFVLLQILTVAERLGLDPDPLGPDAGALARVFAAASRDRDRHLADPDAMLAHPSTLLDDGHLAGLADDVRAALAATSIPPKPAGDTIALVTADAEGWGVSLIQSLFWDFGSGILEPTTGIAAQNRGACFTLAPDHPNTFAPGKLPAHTLMPVLVHDERGLVGVAGSMGGYGQPQINAQTVTRVFLLGTDPEEAIRAPRWIVGGIEPGNDEAYVHAEAGVPVRTVERFAEAGFDVEMAAPGAEDVGHAHLIRVGTGGLEAGSDPRADGGALAG